MYPANIPDLPKSKIQASATTNGGLTIGKVAIKRNICFPFIGVRVIAYANINPTTVPMVATKTPKIMELSSGWR
jgi:hypothetical protein